MATKSLATEDLKPGMVLADDVIVHGRVLLKSGMVLNQGLIERLLHFKVHSTLVAVDDTESVRRPPGEDPAQLQKQFQIHQQRVERLFAQAYDDRQLPLLKAPIMQYLRERYRQQDEQFEKKVLAAISGENSLATLGGVVAKIQEVAVSDNDSAIRELIRLVEADIVLTTKILHVVNSVSAGVSRRVATIDEAVVLLGFNKIKNLCIGIACIEKLGVESRCKNFDRTHLWHHSLGTALASRLIENLLADAETGDLFVAGLLCNVGRVILDQHFPQELARILKLAEERRIRVIEAEREVLGATHAEIGYWALKAWNIDDKLARIVRDHHGPLGTREADIINLAYVLTQIMGLGSPGDSMLAQLIPGVLERLGFDELKFGELFMALDREYRAAEPMLKIMTETAPKPA